MKNTVDVRGWTKADLETVRHITWITWVDAYGSFIPKQDLRTYFDKAYALHELKHLLASPDFRGVLAEVGGVPAGYAKVQFVPAEKRCYVSSLYVLPVFQGEGVGRSLLDHAERLASDFGVAELWLGVMVQNTQALAWYRRVGFQFVEELPFTMGGTTVPHLVGYRSIHHKGMIPGNADG